MTCREPGGTAFGERIRSALLQSGEPPQPEAELLAFAAARAQLVGEIIIPALKRNAIVISDRYADSTVAYQDYGRGLALGVIAAVHAAAVRGPLPDVTLLLDHDPEEARARAPGSEDYIEDEEAEFHARVRNGYLELAAAEPERWCVLDASSGGATSLSPDGSPTRPGAGPCTSRSAGPGPGSGQPPWRGYGRFRSRPDARSQRRPGSEARASMPAHASRTLAPAPSAPPSRAERRLLAQAPPGTARHTRRTLRQPGIPPRQASIGGFGLNPVSR